jgi:hypothetical protein
MAEIGGEETRCSRKTAQYRAAIDGKVTENFVDGTRGVARRVGLLVGCEFAPLQETRQSHNDCPLAR